MTIRAISYGGGVQSTALLVLAAQREIDFPLAIFANVGDDSENPATVDYVRDYAIPYAEANGIEFVTVQRTWRNGDPVTLMGQLQSANRSIDIPVRMANGAPGNRNCTAEFKIKPVAKELKRRGATKDDPAVLALGISVDEYQRMRTNTGIPWETFAYPLIERRIDRAGCESIITRAGLPVPPKSSCFFCPYFSLAQRRRQLSESPDLFERTAQLEDTLNERRAMLGKDRVYMTSRLIPLRLAIVDDGQMDMFAPSCDIGGYCHA